MTSSTAIAPVLGNTPELVHGDLAVAITASAQVGTSGETKTEYEILRLARSGPTRVHFALAYPSSNITGGRSAWGDRMTDIRSGADGKLYQLGSAPTMGVRIMRFSLGRG